MSAKEEFIEIYKENIHREGADRLLEYLHRVHPSITGARSPPAAGITAPMRGDWWSTA